MNLQHKIRLLREALEFYDRAKAAPNGVETGALRDGIEWVFDAAREVVAVEKPVEGLTIHCMKCDATAVLPYTGPARTRVALAPIAGWAIVQGEVICPAHPEAHANAQVVNQPATPR